MMKSLRALLTVAFRFLRGHRGGATGFTTAAVVMMLLGAAPSSATTYGSSASAICS